MIFNRLASLTDISPAGTTGWQTVDVSAYISAAATGVVIVVAKSSYDTGCRMNGSTDNIRSRNANGWTTLYCGVNAAGEIQLYRNNASTGTYYLYGYLEAAVFFANAVTKTVAASSAWTDIDLSGSLTGSGVIVRAPKSASVASGVRCNGSTVALTENGEQQGYALCKVDGGKIEGYTSNHTIDNTFYVIGYFPSNPRLTWNTDPIDRSLGSTGSYVDLTTPAAGADVAVYAIKSSSAASQVWLREDGGSLDYYQDVNDLVCLPVPLASAVAEGKIESTAIDFYEVCYETEPAAQTLTFTAFDLTWAWGSHTIDSSDTGVKITSHQGSYDVPEVISDTTPTVTWTFPRAQNAYNVSFYELDSERIVATSGVVTSSDVTFTLSTPLTEGRTYSIQVQVQDATTSLWYACDERAWVHVNNATLPAPVLTAEADTDSHTAVTLEWAAPATTDGDTHTYTLSVTYTPDGGSAVTSTYEDVDTTSRYMGYLLAGSYSWSVMAEDSHGVESAYSSSDTFTVTSASAVPTAALVPWGPSVNPVVSTWGHYDEDGDAQTAYQLQLANDDAYTDIVLDTGEVTSTDQHYQHAALAAGSYYRRLRVQTGGVDWSAWDTDGVTVVAPTSQTDEIEVYLDALGTPTALDQTRYPVSGVTLTRRLDGPAELRFVVNNFDGTGAGIGDDEELLVYLRASDGTRLTFQGQVVSRKVGFLVEVTAQDIARDFAQWRVTRRLSNVGIGALVKAIAENPGDGSTGITAHCDEVEVPGLPGRIIRCKSFSGNGRSLADYLSSFAACTGYRWYVTWESGGNHLYWCNPETAPTWAYTLRDDIDRADNSSSQLRVGDGVTVTRLRPRGNRVRYKAALTPPSPPAGYATWDDYLTETVSGWTAWDDEVVVSADSAQPASGAEGSHSLKLTYTHTSTGESWPSALPLAYFRLPLELQDQTVRGWGRIYATGKMRLSINGVVKAETDLPQSGCQLYKLTTESAITTPPTGTATAADGSHSIGASLREGEEPCSPPWSTWERWGFYPTTSQSSWSSGFSLFGPTDTHADDWKHVLAWGIGYYYWGATATIWSGNREYIVRPPTVPAGQEIKIELWLDSFVVTGEEPTGRDGYTQEMGTVECYVETAAVTAGTELPREVYLDLSGMSREEAKAMAEAELAEISVAQVSAGGLELDGMRNVPLRSQVALALPNHGLASATYPLAQVEYRPLDSGDTTTLTAGAIPVDPQRSLEGVRKLLDRVSADSLGA